jgi:heat shock protein HtpX
MVAACSTPLVVLASTAAVILFAPDYVVAGFLIAVVVGIIATAGEERHRAAEGRPVSVERAPALHETVDRLCMLADLPKPEIVIEYEEQPNSWMIGLSRGRARLHVTTGLLALLSQSELEAVMAHELAHLAHHDAAVMSATGGSGALLLDAARRIAGSDWWAGVVWPGMLAAGAIGGVSRLATLALSRHRELAADTGAAALTGRPMALASALSRVSGQLARLPEEDLRAAAGRDVFHLLPVDEIERLCGRGATATHPSLTKRLERLERLERQMHGASVGIPRAGRTTASAQAIHNTIAASIERSPMPAGVNETLVAAARRIASGREELTCAHRELTN